jgi:hypothetical protein
MLDVHFPTTDGRWLIFCRYTSPNKLQKAIACGTHCWAADKKAFRIVALIRVANDFDCERISRSVPESSAGKENGSTLRKSQERRPTIQDSCVGPEPDQKSFRYV